MMSGWKTWLGVAVITIGAGLNAAGEVALAKTVMAVGMAIGVVGIGHKLEKN